MSLLPLSPLKKSIYKHFITTRFHYSKFFKIVESVAQMKALNFGIERDRVENVLWQTKNLLIPSSLKNVVTLCGTNHLFTDSPLDIADCIVNIGSCLREKSSSVNVFICGLISKDESWSKNRVLVKDVNRILKYLC